MDQVLERIAAWEAAGLIDSATADRLRLAETERPTEAESTPGHGPSSVASIFGPGVTIGEMFAYLGGAFLLGAYETFVTRLGGAAGRPDLVIAIGSILAAVALSLVGTVLRNGDARRRRAAGLMFTLAVGHIAAAAVAVAMARAFDWPGAGMIGTGVATVAAIGYRLFHPSLLTQVTLLASATSFSGLVLDGLRRSIGSTCCSVLMEPIDPDPLLAAVFSAVWWLTFAVIIGLVGLREARTADEDPAAGRRASLTRLWAGLAAVIGLAMAATRSGETSAGEFGRVIAPWVGELALLILAAILVERAFRRDAGTYVFAAALALIIALSDFNFTYLSSTTELGLLIEGVILLAVGVGADRLRRRLGRSPQVSTADAVA